MSSRLFSVIIRSTLVVAALLLACSPGSASTLFFAPHEVGEEQLPGIVNYLIRQDPAGKNGTIYPLLINPALDYSTYVGGTGEDMGSDIAVDANNNVYITGLTDSPHVTDFGPGGGEADIFVIKLDPSQTGANQLVYETYIGGTGRDRGYGIAVDSSGNAYVAGYTDSTDFPVTANAYQSASGGLRDAVVVQLDAAGAVNYCSYLGGNGNDEAHQVVVGDNTPTYVTGYTDSEAPAPFPTTGDAFQTNHAGAGDAFVTVLDPSQSGNASLVYSTYYGGTGWDAGWGIDESDGIIYFGGHTTSPIPLKNAIQQNYAGAGPATGLGDAYIAKLDPSQSGNDQLLFATYLGGTDDDICAGIAADASGDVCAVGITASDGSGGSIPFPTTSVSPPYGGGVLSSDVFLARISTNGPSLAYSRFVGGSGGEASMTVVLDPSGNAYVAGSTQSNDFPTVNPIQADLGGGGTDAFVAEFDTGGAMTFGTYLGGAGADAGAGIALDPSGRVYVGGLTGSTDFATVNPYQNANAGGNDSFVARISNQFTLTVNVVDGGGSGTVTSSPAGINCGEDCTGNYVKDTVVTLTAHPGLKSYFVGWDGDCSGTDPTAAVTMDTDKTCTATFGYPVGGIVVPVDKLSVLFPWMGLAALVSITALTVVLVRRRKG